MVPPDLNSSSECNMMSLKPMKYWWSSSSTLRSLTIACCWIFEIALDAAYINHSLTSKFFFCIDLRAFCVL